MKKNNQNNPNDRPAAYDAQGRPLYYHPIDKLPKNETPVVHLSRAVAPEKVVIPDDIKQKHDRSIKSYPELNLSAGEYVIKDIRRHPIGTLAPLTAGFIILVLAILVWTNQDTVLSLLYVKNSDGLSSVINIVSFIFVLMAIVTSYISAYIYYRNRFFLTNESIIHQVQSSLFNRSENTILLSNIEDASFTQAGLIQYLFNYGSIRLSTEGEETTYQFTYVSNPKESTDALNNAIEAFKNGRPVED